MRNAQEQIALMDKLRVHCDQYASQSKSSYMTMLEVWSDLEVADDQQRHELEDIMSQALKCWSSALQGLQGRQQAVRDSIQRQLSNIMTIKEELGSDNPAADADLQRLQVRERQRLSRLDISLQVMSELCLVQVHATCVCATSTAVLGLPCSAPSL
jgi:hypothetical protein